MKFIYSSWLISAAAMLMSACQAAPSTSLSAVATGESSSFSVGTLCAVNSFECEVSPSYARIASVVHTATFDFRQGRITAPQLQSIVDRGRGAVAKLDAVQATCRQDARSGKCTGNEELARKLLVEAKQSVASVR